MRVAFVQNLMFEFLGTMYLAAALQQHGHQVEVFIDRQDDTTRNTAQGDARLIREVLEWRPDLAAFSCTTGDHAWAIDVALGLKRGRSGIRTVFGGPHPTFFPQMCDDAAVDFVCRGEGEDAAVELASALATGSSPVKILNLWGSWHGVGFRNDVRPLIQDLDAIAFPDRTLYRRRYPGIGRAQAVVISGRGCPFACTFCFNHALQKIYAGKGRYVRRRSIPNVLAEINLSKSAQQVRTVYFQDDTFLLDPVWVGEFLPAYATAVGLPFFCLATASELNEEIVGRLRRAGCIRVFFGIECGDAELRQTLLGKRVPDSSIRAAARILHAAGIPFRTYNMFGLPGETLDQAWQTIRLNSEIGTDFPWASLFQPYPGTELAEHAHTLGLLNSDPETVADRSFFRASHLQQEHQRDFVVLQRLFSPAVWWPGSQPLIRRFGSRLPQAFLDLIFLLCYAWNIAHSECLTLRETVRLGLGNVRGFFLARRSDRP